MSNDLLTKIQNKIDELEKTKELIGLLPDLSDITHKTSATESTIHISIPFNWKVYTKIRNRFKGWKMNDYWTITQHNDKSVSQHKSLWPNDGRGMYFQGACVSISLDTGLDNSVCHLEKIGVKEVPQYKVVCK